MEPIADLPLPPKADLPPVHDCTMSATTGAYTDTTVTFSTIEMTTKSAPVTTTEPMYDVTNGGGFFEGLLGCLRPMWTIIGKNKDQETSLGKYVLFLFHLFIRLNVRTVLLL